MVSGAAVPLLALRKSRMMAMRKMPTMAATIQGKILFTNSTSALFCFAIAIFFFFEGVFSGWPWLRPISVQRAEEVGGGGGRFSAGDDLKCPNSRFGSADDVWVNAGPSKEIHRIFQTDNAKNFLATRQIVSTEGET